MLSNGCSGTSELLTLVLGLLHCLARSLDLGKQSLSDKTVLGLELHHRLLVVVNEAESGGFSSSELGTETEGDAELGVSLVHGSNDGLKLALCDICASGVDNVYNHL